MRVLAEIFIIGGLIYLGWQTPFKDWVDDARSRLTGKPTTVAPQEVVPAPPTPTPRPRIVPVIQGLSTPTPHGAWRLDPNHRSVLDRPAYDQTQPSAPARYRDASGRSYWIDAQGVRHYDQE